ncbi:MAG: amino acid ABC transporter substrate-binding protein [Eubacterium sp.]|nr:amino acid ABC transporter substrate-binding protein [Eubacterium sp.]
MKFKKLAALALSMALAASMLMGCGGSSSKDTAESDTQAAGNETAAFTTVNDGVLTMATNAQFPPYEFYDGSNIVGIDAEIAKAVADKLGLELKIEDMEFNSIIGSVQSGKVDMGLAGMTVTEERKQSVNFTESYATGIQSIIVKEGSDIKTVDDLTGKKIGVQLSTTGDIYATDDYGEENVEKYNKGADAVQALITDKVDCVIIDNQPAKAFVADNEGLKILDTEYTTEEYAACLSKDNEALLKAVDGAIKELKEDGTIQSILDKYIVAD